MVWVWAILVKSGPLVLVLVSREENKTGYLSGLIVSYAIIEPK